MRSVEGPYPPGRDGGRGLLTLVMVGFAMLLGAIALPLPSGLHIAPPAALPDPVRHDAPPTAREVTSGATVGVPPHPGISSMGARDPWSGGWPKNSTLFGALPSTVRGASTAAIGISSPTPSPVLGPYDPSALLVPVGGSRPLSPEALLWSGDGDAYASGANLTWNVSPTGLGTVTPGGFFVAGAEPGNGTVTVLASWNQTSSSDQVPVVVYAPACVLLSLDRPAFVLSETGSNLSLSARLLDQTGAPCSGAPALTFSVVPSSFGELTSTGAGAVVLHVNATEGVAWVNASVNSGGQLRAASMEVEVPPVSAGVLFHVFPQDAEVPEGAMLPLSASALDGWGVPLSGSYAWTLNPASLGTISATGSDASFFASSAPGTGWANVTFQGPRAGTLVASIQLRVLPIPPPSASTAVGLLASFLDVPPLYPGEGVPLSLQGTDALGDPLPSSLNVTWSLHPFGLGNLFASGAQTEFIAGQHVGNGSVVATVHRPGLPDLIVPFPISIVPVSLSTVSLFGGPSDHVPVGGATALEGVAQDRFGNLLLAGGFYGLQYATMSTRWTVVPSTLGTVVPNGNGTPNDLPEQAIFYASSAPGTGVVIESIAWAGQTWNVSFPIVVDQRSPAAVVVFAPVGPGPSGALYESSSVTLSSFVLDQRGYPSGTVGSFAWRLEGGSSANLTGSTVQSAVLLETSDRPGWVLGNLTWTDAGRSVTVEFLLDVVRAPTTVSMLSITPGGPSGSADAVEGDVSVLAPTASLVLSPPRSGLTLGTSAVPGATGSPNWTLSPSWLGSLSNTAGSEVNLTLGPRTGNGWLNVSVRAPDGTWLMASVPISIYQPRLTYLLDLTGPCSQSCSGGLATFAGNSAFLGLEPLDQLGAPLVPVNWSASVSPSSLAGASAASWKLGAGSELVEVQANASAGNGSLEVDAEFGGAQVGLSLPIEVVASPVPLSPGPPSNLTVRSTGNLLALRWQPPADPGAGRVVNYTVEWVQGNGSALPQYLGTSTAFLNLSRLSPGITYHLRVRASNSLGLSGPWSLWVEVTTSRLPSPVVLPWSGPDLSTGAIAVPLVLGTAALSAALVSRGRRARGRTEPSGLSPSPPVTAPPYAARSPAPLGPGAKGP